MLKDVSFVIPKGKVTAIVGENGSGKSTIIKLLERFNEPVSGAIRLGDADMRDVNLAQWRGAVGCLFQSDQVVKGSIRENICYGLDRVWTEEVRRAVELALADDFIQAKSGGLDADISRFDSKLSGRELQRVAIVRIILKQPWYLIMDEATSGIDVVGESEVLESLSNMMRGRTVIVVLNDGVIEASGSYDQVLEGGPLFQRLAAV